MIEIKWEASSRWPFDPNSARGSKETATIGKTHAIMKTIRSKLNSGEGSNFFENSELISMIKLFNENGFYHECSQWIYELLSNSPSLGSRKRKIFVKVDGHWGK